MASGKSSNIRFQYNGTNNWLYIVWSSVLQSNGNTSLKATLRFRMNYQLRGTWYFKLGTNKGNVEFSYYFNKLDNSIKDFIIGEHTWTFTPSEYSTTSPSTIRISASSTINGRHIYSGGNTLLGTASGYVDAKVDLWSLPTGLTGNATAPTNSSIRVTGSSSNNPNSMYRFIGSVQEIGTSNTTTVNGTYGNTSYTNTFTSLKPYTRYLARLLVEERYGLVTKSAVQVMSKEILTPDTVPSTVTVRVQSVGRDQASVVASSTSKSPVQYSFKIANRSWTTYGNNSSHTFTGLSPNTNYTVRVRAQNLAGVSEASTTVKTTYDPPTIEGTVSNYTVSSMRVTLTGTSDVGIQSYSVSIDGGKTYPYSQTNGVFNLTGLSPGTTYIVYGRVTDTTGITTRSNSILAKTLYSPPVVSGITSQVLNSKSSVLTISGSALAGISLYRVYHGSTKVAESSRSSIVLYDGVANTTRSYSVSIVDSTDTESVKVNISVKYPGETSAIDIATSAPVKFIRNTLTNLALVPIKDGQVLVDTTSGTMYYDISDKRVLSGSNTILTAPRTGSLYKVDESLATYLTAVGVEYNVKFSGVEGGDTPAVIQFGSSSRTLVKEGTEVMNNSLVNNRTYKLLMISDTQMEVM